MYGPLEVNTSKCLGRSLRPACLHKGQDFGHLLEACGWGDDL